MNRNISSPYRCNRSDMETRRMCLRRMRGSGGGGVGGCTPNTFSPAARQCVVSAAAVASSPSAFVCARPRERLRVVHPCTSVYNVPCFRYRYHGHQHDGRFVVTRSARSSRSQSGRAPVTARYLPWGRRRCLRTRHKTTAAEGGYRHHAHAAVTVRGRRSPRQVKNTSCAPRFNYLKDHRRESRWEHEETASHVFFLPKTITFTDENLTPNDHTTNTHALQSSGILRRVVRKISRRVQVEPSRLVGRWRKRVIAV